MSEAVPVSVHIPTFNSARPLTGRSSDIYEELIKEKITDGTDDPAGEFCTAMIHIKPFDEDDKQERLDGDVKKRQEAVPSKMIYMTVVSFEDEILMEEK